MVFYQEVIYILGMLGAVRWLTHFSLVIGLFLGLNSGLAAIEEPLTNLQNLLTADPKGLDIQTVIQVAALVAADGRYWPDSNTWELQDAGKSVLALPYDPTAVIDRLIAANPQEAPLWLAQANLWWLAVNTIWLSEPQRQAAADRAIEAYKKSLQLGIDNAVIYERLGLLLLDRGDDQHSVGYLEAAYQRKPDNADIGYNLAYALYAQGQFGNALHHIQTVYDSSQLEPDQQLNARLLYGDVLLAVGNPVAAATIYQKTVAAYPENLYPLRRLVECYLITNDELKLSQAIQTYIARSATEPEAISRLSAVFTKYQQQNRFLAIAKDYRLSLVKTNPETAAAGAFIEAQMLASLGQKLEALARLVEGLGYLQDQSEVSPLGLEMARFKTQLER